MDPSINSTLTALGDKSPQVAHLARARDAAINAERDTEAALLERAIELLRPALEAISSRIPIAYREQVGSTQPAEHTFSQTRRGLCLVDGYARDASDVEGGNYYGERLYLLQDGTLLVTRREGHWSEEEEALCEWEVVEERPLTCRDAMDEYGLAECLEPMFYAVDKPLKGMVEPIRRTHERTERLRAILTLL